MDIGIVGYGFVGKKMHAFFGPGNVTAVHDPLLGLVNEKGVNRADLAIVCVPTPSLPGGGCDVSVVEEVVRWIEAPVILIRSTVVPGTTSRLAAETGKALVFCPEYLGEGPGALLRDEKGARWWILGTVDQEASRVCSKALRRAANYPIPIYLTTPTIAEAVKYFENEYLAWNVVFAAEMWEACQALELPYEEVRTLWALDSRVCRSHTRAFPGNLGFGGKCLPKDVEAWLQRLREAGYEKRVLAAVIGKNEGFQDREPTIEVEGRGGEARRARDSR